MAESVLDRRHASAEQERQRVERALHEQRDLLQNIILHIPFSVFWKDRNGVYLGCNERSARDMGVESPEQIIGKTDDDTPSSHEEAAYYVECDRRVMETGEPLLNIEETQLRADGTRAHLLTSKVPLRAEDGTVTGVLGIYADITEQKRTEEALRQSEERYRAHVENAYDIIYAHDLAGNLSAWNTAGERILGYTAKEMQGMNIARLLAPDQLETARRMIAAKAVEGGRTVYELEVLAKDGRKVRMEISSWLVRRDGEPPEIHGIARDITERHRLEERLRMAAKMEAVGQLAGGIAHDFNNLLTVINGYSAMLVDALKEHGLALAMVEEINRAGERAANLTRQLLAYSRKQVLQCRLFDLNEVVKGLDPMLRRLIGEDVKLVTHLEPDASQVRADPGQIEQVVMNLAVNARDAMPRGGRLTLETKRLRITTESPGLADVPPGDYVRLSVIDTGCGMDAETLAHLFEPFFTTKEVGKGTGLGLAMVYGIVKQSEGHLTVESEVGCGSAFRIHLPAASGSTVQALPGGRPALASGHGTILVVEDEESVGRFICQGLCASGYQVLAAAGAEEALLISDAASQPIDLLITDVVMPGMSGPELAERIIRARPDIRVLYLSGYTEDEVVRRGVRDRELAFLQKPFSLEALTQRVRDLLEGPGEPCSTTNGFQSADGSQSQPIAVWAGRRALIPNA